MQIYTLEIQTTITSDRSNMNNYHIPISTKTMKKAW